MRICKKSSTFVAVSLGSLAIEKGWVHQKKVIDMLEQMSKDAVSIYMLGDMFDFWMEYFRHDSRKQQFEPFFQELRKLTKKGIHVHFFSSATRTCGPSTAAYKKNSKKYKPITP